MMAGGHGGGHHDGGHGGHNPGGFQVGNWFTGYGGYYGQPVVYDYTQDNTPFYFLGGAVLIGALMLSRRNS